MDLSRFEALLEEDVSIYLDTNCLLNLYSYPNRVTNNFMSSFNEITDYRNVEIRISSFVKKEYERNLTGKKREKLSRLKKLQTSIPADINKFDKVLKDFQIAMLQNDTERISDITAIFPDLEGIKSSLNELINSKIEDAEQNIAADDYFNAVDNFIGLILDQQNVINEPSYDEKIQNTVSGYVRAKHNIPPGYEDMKDKYYKVKKNAKGNKLKPEQLNSYLNDYFIWLDILKDDRSTSAKLFVTGDLKEDWWKIPNTSKLTDYEPRNELIEESEGLNQTGIEFIPLDLFILYINGIAGIIDPDGFLTINWDSDIEETISENILNSGNLENEIESHIWDDGSVTKGYKVQESSIDLSDIVVKDYEIFNIEEFDPYSEREFNIKEIQYDCTVYYEGSGSYSVSLGLEEDVYETDNGDFKISDGFCEVTLKAQLSVKNINGSELFGLDNTETRLNVENINGVGIDSVSFESSDYFYNDEDIY